MNHIISKIALATLIGAASLSADTREKIEIKDHDLKDTILVRDTDEGTKIFMIQTSKRDRFYWGPDVFWTNESPQIKGIHVKDNSVYYGLKAGYDFLRPNAIYAGIHGLYALGKMHIKTHPNTEEKAYKNNVPGNFANGELRLGYNFKGNQPIYVTPFLGMGGYHSRPTRSVHLVQNWLYAAIGMRTEYEVNEDINVGLNVKGTRALYLEQRVKRGKHSASYHNSSNALGYEVSLPVSVSVGHAGNWRLTAEPYYIKLNSNSKSNLAGGFLSFSANY